MVSIKGRKWATFTIVSLHEQQEIIIGTLRAVFCTHVSSSPKEDSAVTWDDAQERHKILLQTAVCFCKIDRVGPSTGWLGEEWAVFPRLADEGKAAVGRRREHFWAKCIARLILYHMLLAEVWYLLCTGPLESSWVFLQLSVITVTSH